MDYTPFKVILSSHFYELRKLGWGRALFFSLGSLLLYNWPPEIFLTNFWTLSYLTNIEQAATEKIQVPTDLFMEVELFWINLI